MALISTSLWSRRSRKGIGETGTWLWVRWLLHQRTGMSRVEVRLASTPQEREAIYKLRYRVYIEEMDGAARHTEADSATRQLRDEYDEAGRHFYVSQDDRIVACARLNQRRDGPLECESQLELPRFSPAYPDQVSM